MITLLLTLSALFVIFFAVFYALKQRFTYWKKKNVPHLEPALLLGNFSNYILLKKYFGQVTQEICQKFPGAPYIGAYYGTEPTLIVQDPEVIKLVLTKDFYYFSGREISKYTDKELLTRNLFFTYGDKWKVLRQNLTPLFSSAKMKNMFHLIEKCSRVFETTLDNEVKISNSLEVRSLMARFTMDCIGSSAFGVDTNTMESKDNNPFYAIGNEIFDTKNFRSVKNVTRAIWPSVFYGLGLTAFPKKIDVFFCQLLKGIFKGRSYKPSARNDFVDLILKLSTNKSMTGDCLKSSESKKVDLEVDDDFLVAQCVLFFAAGYETSATTTSFVLYELAKNQEAQQRVLDEVDGYLQRHENMLKYECVAEMTYLDACIDEALRLYPVLGVLTREVVEDYTLSSGLRLEKGIRVHLPVYHLHLDPDNFPEPDKYRPERFLEDEKHNIKPYTYIPFGEGPRVCIGKRFAKMQIIAGLITLFKKYRVELAEGMERSVVFNPGAIVTQPIGGINLKFIVREGWEWRVYRAPNGS